MSFHGGMPYFIMKMAVCSYLIPLFIIAQTRLHPTCARLYEVSTPTMTGISAGPLTVHHAAIRSATAWVVGTIIIATSLKCLTVVVIAVQALISFIPCANLPCQVLQFLPTTSKLYAIVTPNYWY